MGGIPIVEIKSDGVLAPLIGLLQRQAAFVIIFSISAVHVGIGWMAYRLFHLLSPDVQRAFLASSDVRWTILVGAVWVVGLLMVASALVLRLVNAQVAAPIADLARVSESVANGELAVPFVPSTANNEVGRLSRATLGIIVVLRRLATTMRSSARNTTALASQISAASENMAAAAQQTAATSNALSHESKTMARTIHEIAADATKLEEVSASLQRSCGGRPPTRATPEKPRAGKPRPARRELPRPGVVDIRRQRQRQVDRCARDGSG